MTDLPRRRQQQTFIRSDKAAALIREMARHGQTKVSIMEEVLERAVREAERAQST